MREKKTKADKPQGAVNIGDKIKTTGRYKPVDINGNMLEARGGLTGTVIMDIGMEDVYMIKFDTSEPWMHTLGGSFAESCCYEIESKHFKVIEKSNFGEGPIGELIKKNMEHSLINISSIPSEILSINADIQSKLKDISNLKRQIKTVSDKVAKNYKAIEEAQESRSKTVVDTDLLHRQYEKMLANKDIKSIEIDNGILYVKTNDLTYKHRDDSISPFVIGAYVLRIELDNFNVKAANYKKHIMKSTYHHPCVNEFNICLGSMLQGALMNYFSNCDYISIIYNLVNFLKEPNYGNPHIDAGKFHYAQPVDKVPDTLEEYFTTEFWNTVSWDGEAYSRGTVL